MAVEPSTYLCPMSAAAKLELSATGERCRLLSVYGETFHPGISLKEACQCVLSRTPASLSTAPIAEAS